MPPATLNSDALIVRAAELRAHGLSWDATAARVHTTPDELRQLVRDLAPEYREASRAARKEVADEAFTEALLTLRRELRSDDDEARRFAAGCLLKLRMTLMRHRPRRPAAAAMPRRSAEDERLIAFLTEHTDEELDEFIRAGGRGGWDAVGGAVGTDGGVGIWPPLPHPVGRGKG